MLAYVGSIAIASAVLPREPQGMHESQGVRLFLLLAVLL